MTTETITTLPSTVAPAIYAAGGVCALQYLEPLPPQGGSSWADELDYPGVEVELALPTARYIITLSLPMPDGMPEFFGEGLSPDWGRYSELSHLERTGYPAKTGFRTRKYVVRRPTLEEAEARCLELIAEADAVLAQITSARALRLAHREATIAAAHSRPGKYVCAPQ